MSTPSTNAKALEIKVSEEETLFGINTNPRNAVVALVASPFISAAKVAAFALKFIFDIIILLPMGFSGACRKGTTIASEFKNSFCRIGVDIRAIARNIIKTIPVAGFFIAKGFNKLTYKIAGGKDQGEVLTVPKAKTNPKPSGEGVASQSKSTHTQRGRQTTRSGPHLVIEVVKAPEVRSGEAHGASAGSGPLAPPTRVIKESLGQEIIRLSKTAIPEDAIRLIGDVLSKVHSGEWTVHFDALKGLGPKLSEWALSDLDPIRVNRSNKGISDNRDLEDLKSQIEVCQDFHRIIQLTRSVVALLIHSQENLPGLQGEKEFMQERLCAIEEIVREDSAGASLQIVILKLCKLQIEDDIFWSEDVRATRMPRR